MSKWIYVIHTEWKSVRPDGVADVLLGSNVSQEGYETDTEAMKFIADRADYVTSNGWAGFATDGGIKTGYFIKAIRVPEAK